MSYRTNLIPVTRLSRSSIKWSTYSLLLGPNFHIDNILTSHKAIPYSRGECT
eukprot:Gb_33243 [translate_table: standard]